MCSVRVFVPKQTDLQFELKLSKLSRDLNCVKEDDNYDNVNMVFQQIISDIAQAKKTGKINQIFQVLEKRNLLNGKINTQKDSEQFSFLVLTSVCCALKQQATPLNPQWLKKTHQKDAIPQLQEEIAALRQTPESQEELPETSMSSPEDNNTKTKPKKSFSFSGSFSKMTGVKFQFRRSPIKTRRHIEDIFANSTSANELKSTKSEKSNCKDEVKSTENAPLKSNRYMWSLVDLPEFEGTNDTDLKSFIKDCKKGLNSDLSYIFLQNTYAGKKKDNLEGSLAIYAEEMFRRIDLDLQKQVVSPENKRRFIALCYLYHVYKFSLDIDYFYLLREETLLKPQILEQVQRLFNLQNFLVNDQCLLNPQEFPDEKDQKNIKEFNEFFEKLGKYNRMQEREHAYYYVRKYDPKKKRLTQPAFWEEYKDYVKGRVGAKDPIAEAGIARRESPKQLPEWLQLWLSEK